ncbi:MAG TPA: PEP/pyruvate-binding domain-containing protein [Tenuifilaceae bacterium]|nr:PEP/pyruvate-binding domain-containing protein [Tenuifilaceae bacterium]HPE17695.1 PEP/pyruvate-binding domain-containing protein [Tenuifilaceae bacterium]HPJ45198.1 PEP/pyruvate-binding domain-containing protein [Tenuifilaceae bacterium]HPQ33427.1 PEP/pyruvate-binding domain-containing protein [Tenuifilaceae bacterium]HRX66933.1 PEP/pyruvate-binding domain-containing protein [Tenuifilaceae bacterium]
MTSSDIEQGAGKYYFAETAFDLLMKRRILNVLLICSKYDTFMLEEDGRIEEQIFNEYVNLNLRYPPKFIHVTSAEEAFVQLKEQPIDLIITMLKVEGMDPFTLAKEIKGIYPKKPIVVLTPFSREVSIKLSREDLSAIDYVFSWLGNAQIMLAIIKLIEDSMNAEHDVNKVGVQTILLVEDSVRFYSSYLPNIYRIIFTQSKQFMSEGLNEHQKMLRMRGRPKILLARNLEQATALYQRYKHNMLGVITDMSYPHNGKMLQRAGVKMIEMVKADNPYMPILLQSSDVNNQLIAKRHKVGFIHKYSKALSLELHDFIVKYFAFGDFVFIDPESGREIFRASDLRSLQEIIFQVPDDSLQYHIERNHFSKWLTARALFPIADIFKYISPSDFENLEEVRRFIFDTIDRYRESKGRGIIAKFYRDSYDEYQIFSRIGDGSLGGKGRGLAFIDSVIKRSYLMHRFENVVISIPRTVVICTDVFDEFMESNNLYSVALSDANNDEILRHFLNAPLPLRIHKDLYSFIAVARNPIAIRSSSLLEDSHYQPFAGVYATYMVPNVKESAPQMLELLSQAIKCVYASVYTKESKAYMLATHNVIEEERMAIVLQEVVGTAYGNRFYPNISGVARSLNFYPIKPETPKDGIASIAFGLGKHVVEGKPSLRFSPKFPKKLLQLSSPQMALKETQKTFFALDLRASSFVPSTDDAINLFEPDIKQAFDDGTLAGVASTYDYDNQTVRDGYSGNGVPVVSFASILKHRQFPLPEILMALLEVGQLEMNNPVEIEFAVNLNPPKGQPKFFGMLQIRPIVQSKEVIHTDFESIPKEKILLFSPLALGNGVINDLVDIVYVKSQTFDSAKTCEIALELESVNAKFLREGRRYILMGPGRWGSSDKWLGIPVKWPQISAAQVIVEAGQENYKIDPSQGTHFFQNLTSFKVAYLTVNEYMNQGFIDRDYLDSLPAEYESEMIRHVRSCEPVQVIVNGQEMKGVVLKSCEITDGENS